MRSVGLLFTAEQDRSDGDAERSVQETDIRDTVHRCPYLYHFVQGSSDMGGREDRELEGRGARRGPGAVRRAENGQVLGDEFR